MRVIASERYPLILDAEFAAVYQYQLFTLVLVINKASGISISCLAFLIYGCFALNINIAFKIDPSRQRKMNTLS